MKNKRLRKYLDQEKATKNDPIRTRQDLQNSTDERIDQDFPGLSTDKSKEKTITPTTKQEKKIAALGVKDGEKMNKKEIENASEATGRPEEDNGSANAFEGTERVGEDE